MADPKGLDFSKLATYSINTRKSLVSKDDFAQPWTRGENITTFLGRLPSILAGKDIRMVINAIAKAAKNKHQVCFAMGGHVIKTGMNPILIDLMEKNIISVLAMNGSCIIHDLETALTGQTSEDVADSITSGSFGMARETSELLNQAIESAGKEDLGLGRAVGRLILDQDLPFKELSLTAAGARLDLPVTVHVAMGTDIIHMHPDFDGAACGKASHDDFFTLAQEISKLEKGVFINAGSAVILPEVFLKALTLVRNLGHHVDEFTTVNLDFIRHYRPMTNVVNRPTLGRGKGYSLVGHHEILIPLIAAGVIESV
ncbi:MAG: deoxyhypusine synthase family protein [Desulfobacter sp.]|nr:MAG: deoxyhypusine synthase family protein [Desulfobacter sp.]